MSESTNVGRQMVSGVIYTAISKYSGILISLGVSAILSRLLPPEDFGIVAVATVFIMFFCMFSDMGIGAAVVQFKELTEEELSDIFSFTFWFGVLLSAGFYALSWTIASFYHSEALRPICQVLSLVILFAALNMVPGAMLYREKLFKYIAFRNFFVNLLGGIISVVAVLKGAGIYALLINPVFSAVASFVFSYRKYPLRLKLHFSWNALKKIYSFSSYQLMFDLLNYFSRNLDKMILGKYLGVRLLGYYDKSYRLMMLPLQNITQVITPVMHPLFADFQHDYKVLSDSYAKVVRFLAFVGFPLTALLFFSSEELIRIVFGPQWGPAVPSFRILALSVGFQMISSTFGSVFQAANATRELFIAGLISTLTSVTAILTGVFFFASIEAVAWGLTISSGINFVLAALILYRKTLEVSMKLYNRQYISPLILTCLVSIALWFCSLAIISWGPLLSLILKGFVSVVIASVYIQCTGEWDIIASVRMYLSKIKCIFPL